MTYSRKSNSKSKNNNDQWRNFSFSSSSSLVSRSDKKPYGSDACVCVCFGIQTNTLTHAYDCLFCWYSWRCATETTNCWKVTAKMLQWICSTLIRAKHATDVRKQQTCQHTHNHIEAFCSIWLWVVWIRTHDHRSTAEISHAVVQIKTSSVSSLSHIKCERKHLQNEENTIFPLQTHAYWVRLFFAFGTCCIGIFFGDSALFHQRYYWMPLPLHTHCPFECIIYLGFFTILIAVVWQVRCDCVCEWGNASEWYREWHCCVIPTQAHSQYDSWQRHYLTLHC